MRIELLKMAKNNYWFAKTVMEQNKNMIKKDASINIFQNLENIWIVGQ